MAPVFTNQTNTLPASVRVFTNRFIIVFASGPNAELRVLWGLYAVANGNENIEIKVIDHSFHFTYTFFSNLSEFPTGSILIQFLPLVGLVTNQL
jgi:hypothetical protein